jgi:hypothetical protein
VVEESCAENPVEESLAASTMFKTGTFPPPVGCNGLETKALNPNPLVL